MQLTYIKDPYLNGSEQVLGAVLVSEDGTRTVLDADAALEYKGDAFVQPSIFCSPEQWLQVLAGLN